MTVVEYMLYSTENLLGFFLSNTPHGMNNVNIMGENGILLYVNDGYKHESFHNNVHVTSKFVSSFWSPLAFGPTVVTSAHEPLKNVTELWKINKNDKIPLPESP